MKPAAVNALLSGDIENFIVASTPGGIEAQEARGQKNFVNSTTLPKDCPRTELEAMGIVFGSDADDLFVNVQLPTGWAKQATSHAMHSDLLDDKGRKRGGIFYKAAFYDRSAHMHVARCITITRRYYDETEETDAAVVSADEGVLFETKRVARRDWPNVDTIETEARQWIDLNYPRWQDTAAYWQ